MIQGSISLTTTEYRLIAYLLAKINRDDTEFNQMTISVKEFKSLLNITGKSYYKVIKDYCSKLAFKGITIMQPDSPKGPEGIWITWFSYVRAQDGNIHVKFNDLLKDSLLQISKNFTKYYLRNIISLNSFYAMRIYELLKQFEKIGDREIEVDDLKFMLGIDKNKYRDFYDIRRKVLTPSIDEINKKTDIKISSKEIKGEGKKITKIKFYIIPNTNDEKENFLIMEFKKLTGETLNKERLKELITNKGLEVVEFYIDNFDKFIKFSEVKDSARFFYKAVMDEYDIPKKPKKYDKNNLFKAQILNRGYMMMNTLKVYTIT
jgi:hypothetical protein